MDDRSPAFSSRIMKVYMEYLTKHYPEVDLDSVLEFVGMTRHDVEDQAHWYSQEQANRFYSIVTEKADEGLPTERIDQMVERIGEEYASVREGLTCVIPE